MKLDTKVKYLAQHNVDSGAFHTDPMYDATIGHAVGATELHSNNVKRSYNGRKAAKASLSVSGGYVADSREPQKANVLSKSARRRARRTGRLPQDWR